MKKVLIGIGALLLLAGGAFLGVIAWSKSQAAAQVEHTFAALRQSGATATHGGVGFDLFSRTLTISNIAIRSADGSKSVKMASLLADGVTPVVSGRFSAERIELNALEVSVDEPSLHQKTVYNAPVVRIRSFEGPANVLAVPDGTGKHEAVRFGLAQFGAAVAARVEVPDLAGHVTTTPPKDRPHILDASYRQLLAEGIKGGKIATLSFDRMSFENVATGPGPEERMSGRLDNFNASEIDTTPILALASTGATHGTGGGYRTIYGRLAATGYSLTQTDGPTMSVGSILAEGVGLDPAIISFNRLDELAALSQDSRSLSPDQSARLFDISADVLKGAALVSAELKNIKVGDAQSSVEVDSLGMRNFRDGVLESFALRGLQGKTSDGQLLKLDALVLKGFSLTPVFAVSAKAMREGTEPSVEAGLALLQGLRGIEISGLSYPEEAGQPPVTLQHLDMAWGDYVGMLPGRFTLKVSRLGGPISEGDSAPFSYLANAGMKEATLDLDLGLAYDRASGTLTLDPARLMLDKAATLSAKATLTNVPASAFEDPVTLVASAPAIAPGPMTLTLTDHGLVEMAVRGQAQAADQTPEAFRDGFLAELTKTADQAAPAFPSAPGIAAAIGTFLKDPGTLTVSVTPRDGARLMDVLGSEPLLALQNFSITVTATKP
ncbi:hypothetical protein J5J86_04520 [Aquabacter sp. L1I39]|uniref:hypothetical protein n=1 Tax=Aquabacter sp. L1I39 TaxID=2820278 RepID=UPI001ADB6195|nr:hypothetical protein [Aquabacter sp. L1I39]QTL04605.1 hypothetical protein J5J86_04520 [Aquabacter sp. L1I39]